MFAEEVDIVGTVPRCRDCRVTFRLSPNSPKRKAARSGTAPYSLIALASLFTHCSSLVARPPYGALGDRALQPHRSCPPLAGVQGVVARLPSGTVGNRSLQPHCSLLAHLTARSGTAPYSLVALLFYSNLHHRILILSNHCINRQQRHPFRAGLRKKQSVEWIFMKRRQRINFQGVFRSHRNFRITIQHQHFSQTIRIGLEILSSQPQFNDDFPDACRAKKQTVIR